ncbi:MAG TPA: MBL fold metallo-hydrolase [Candidatus Methylomirabilis sp.]
MSSVWIKWFPPSWLQIQAEGKLLYVDPAYLRTYFRKYPTKVEFSKWPGPIDGLPEELEKADLILVTHKHRDHCKRVTVDRLRRPDTLVVGPKGCMKELGQESKALEAGDEIAVGDIEVRAVEAYNTKEGSSICKLHKKGSGLGYVIAAEGQAIYHAGDTDLIPEMRELGEIEVALLPIGGTFTMNLREALEAALTISPEAVIPIHHLRADPQKFKRELEGRSKIEVVLPAIGQAYRLE